MTWRDPDGDPGSEWNDLLMLQVRWLPLHLLRQAVERARFAPDCLKGAVLHDDKSTRQCPNAKRLLEPPAQPFTLRLGSHRQSIQSTVSWRRKNSCLPRKSFFLVRHFSSRVKSTLRSGLGAGDAGFVRRRGDQRSAPFPRERAPTVRQQVSAPLTFHSAEWHGEQRSGLAQEMACEESAHSNLSICVKTAQPGSPISSPKFGLPGSHLSKDF